MLSSDCIGTALVDAASGIQNSLVKEDWTDYTIIYKFCDKNTVLWLVCVVQLKLFV